MVNDFRAFTAWALGALTMVVAGSLQLALPDRAWVVGLVLLSILLFVAFYQECGKACKAAIHFIVGGVEAEEIRRQLSQQALEQVGREMNEVKRK